ncbi:MAG: hypothetical protein NXI30_04075 [bacterium]|nr:hypothetical protein [bacterium]
MFPDSVVGVERGEREAEPAESLGGRDVSAFAVGHTVSGKTEDVRTIGRDSEVGRVEATTFDRLVRSAERRLLGLRERLGDRYTNLTGESLADRVFDEDGQGQLVEAR